MNDRVGLDHPSDGGHGVGDLLTEGAGVAVGRGWSSRASSASRLSLPPTAVAALVLAAIQSTLLSIPASRERLEAAPATPAGARRSWTGDAVGLESSVVHRVEIVREVKGEVVELGAQGGEIRVTEADDAAECAALKLSRDVLRDARVADEIDVACCCMRRRVSPSGSRSLPLHERLRPVEEHRDLPIVCDEGGHIEHPGELTDQVVSLVHGLIGVLARAVDL